MTQYPAGFEVFAFKGRQIEHVILRGEIAIPIDDIVRAIAARGRAEAVALRHPGVAEVDGESYRAVFCGVEFAGRRVDRVVALKFGPQGKPVASRVLYDDRGAVSQEGCWLGVKPKHAEIDLFMMKAPGGFTPEG